MINDRSFPDRASLEKALAEDIVRILSHAIEMRGTAVFLVSGGSSPRGVYNVLSQADIDWSRVYVALVDERWVSSDHEASNEMFIRKNLLTGAAAKAHLVGMKTSAADVHEGLAECEQRYAALPARPDVCLLGMGSDGHTASLFPHATGLEEAIALPVSQASQVKPPRCAAIGAIPSAVTGPYTQRMTVTLDYLSSARKRLLLITGAEKRSVYEMARAGVDISDMPVRALFGFPLDVFWAP